MPARLKGPDGTWFAISDAEIEAASEETETRAARVHQDMRMRATGVLLRFRRGQVNAAEAARELGLDPAEFTGLCGRHGIG